MYPYKSMEEADREIPKMAINRFKTLPLDSSLPIEDLSNLGNENPESIMAWRLWAQRGEDSSNAQIKEIPMFRRILN